MTELAVTIAFITMLSWVRTAPFGEPVVPEVYRMTASSDGSRETWVAIASISAARRSSRSTSSPPITASSLTPACSAAGAPWASSGAAAISMVACESVSTNPISLATSRACTGTTTAPRDSAA